MKIVLMGPPASGKGSQATLLEKQFNLPHISTGDMFRSIMTEDTPLGRQVNEYMERAELVPDSVSIEVVQKHLQKPEYKKGFILDGYPRTLYQATELDKIINIDSAILLDVTFEELEERILTRKICKNCGEVYSTKFYKQDNCSICGSVLETRLDDNAETIKHRFIEYLHLTKPVVKYYKSRKKLFVVKGNAPVKEVFENLKELITDND
jgi:adenylate kinase